MKENNLSNNWRLATLGEIAEIYDKKRIPLSSMQRQQIKGAYPYFGANGILDHINNYIFDGEFVLLAEDGGYWGAFENSAYLVRGKFWVNNHAHIIQSIPELADNQFLVNVLNYLDLKPFISGTTRGKLNQGVMKDIPIPLPPLPEQRAIAQALRAVQGAREARLREVALERERKAALMEHLFTHGTRGEATKMTEIGEMPESWEVTRIQNLLDRKILDEIQDGNHGERHPKNKDFSADGIPFLTADCIRNGKIYLEKANHLNTEWLNRLRIGFAKPGDVLLTHKGTVGESSILGNNYPIAILSPQVTYYRIADHQGLNREFLLTFFQCPIFKSQLEAFASTQSTRAYVGIMKQRRIKIPLPDSIEQQSISQIITACDSKIAALEREARLLEELFRAMLEELMSGRLPAGALVEDAA